MLTIPSFSLGNILTFYKVIKIYNNSGEEIPFVCMSNNISAQWEVPTHPTDNQVVIGDTIYRNPRTITLDGHVYIKHWERFVQLLYNNITPSQYSDSVIDTIRKNINTRLDDIFGTGSSEEFKTNDMRNNGYFNISLLGGVYEKYLLTNIEKGENSEQNSGFNVSLTFMENIIAQSSSRVITVDEEKFAQSGNTINIGSQEALRSTGHYIIFPTR